jgi:phosphopantetheinyl transferase
MLSSIQLHFATTPSPLQTFSAEEMKHFTSYSHESARQQALLGMSLKRQILGSGVQTLLSPMSLSHTQGLAVLAVHPEAHQCIGVDVEHCRRADPSPKALQWLCLDDSEKAMIQQLPPLGAWCVKEALWKAWRLNANTVIKVMRLLDVTPSLAEGFSGKAQAPTGELFEWSLRTHHEAREAYYLSLACLQA